MVVLITGVPGSGKTTLARQLAPILRLPLLSMDVIKETLFATLGVHDRDWSRKLSHASQDVIWALLPDFPHGALIDLWLDPTRDVGVAEDGLRRAGVRNVVEVLCDVPGRTAADRYAGRTRHPGHLPPDESTLDRIRNAAELIAPLGLGPARRADTSRDVDLEELAAWIARQSP